MVYNHWCKCMNPRGTEKEEYKPTQIEHVANCVTHGFWIIPSIFGAVYLHTLSQTHTQKFIAWIYGVSLILLFAISTMYHILSLTEQYRKLKSIFHLSDRAMIYMFIAASYMPWLILQDMKSLWVEHIIWILWVGAVTGTVYTYCFQGKYEILETVLYLIIGICPAITLIIESENALALTELCLGGLFYVSGVAFFQSDGRIPFAHAIWHLFVAMGALCHFYAVCTYLYV